MLKTKIILGYLGFLPFAAFTILPWILRRKLAEAIADQFGNLRSNHSFFFGWDYLAVIQETV